MYGMRDFGPFDGACLPKDTQGFQAWARDHQFPTEILDSVISQNNKYAMYYAEKNALKEVDESAGMSVMPSPATL